MSKIAVIGSGITGITTAYYLVRAGHQVVVFDQYPFPAWGTSYSNGGQLSASNSQVWNTWPTVKKGLKWMLDPAAPLLVNPKPTWAKLKWLAEFLVVTARNRSDENTVKTVELALRARVLYQAIKQEEKIKFDHGTHGIMHIYRDAELFASAKKTAELYRFAGCDQREVSVDRILKIEPALATAGSFVGAFHTPGDSTGDARMFCENLAEVLKEKYDVVFCYSTAVTKIRPTERNGAALTLEHYDSVTTEHFDHAVICAGPTAAQLAKTFGESINVYPVKGYSITIDLVDEKSQVAAPYVSVLDEQKKIVCSRLGDRLRVAGTAELADWDTTIRQQRIDPLVSWVKENFPDVDVSNYRSWTGLRPMTPDMLPIVRQSKVSNNIWFNTGHGHLGWTLSPATAEQLVKLIAAAQ